MPRPPGEKGAPRGGGRGGRGAGRGGGRGGGRGKITRMKPAECWSYLRCHGLLWSVVLWSICVSFSKAAAEYWNINSCIANKNVSV